MAAIRHLALRANDPEAGAVPQAEALPADGRFTETHVTDPAGIRIGLATRWGI